jgi:hypothetical protein
MQVIRPRRIAYIAVLMFIILLALFVIVGIAMILSMNGPSMTEQKGAIFQLADAVAQGLMPVVHAIYEGISAAINQFLNMLGSM